MKAESQFAVAVFAALAVLAVFVCPLTFGPPAPHQKHSPIASLLACALCAAVALIRTLPAIAVSLFESLHPVEAIAPSERLALICTRLC